MSLHLILAKFKVPIIPHNTSTMKKILTLHTALILSLFCYAQANISLTQIATGLTKPVHITHAGDTRLFIVEQAGIIKIIDGNGSLLPTPFMDIRNRVNSTFNEQGLFSIDFHPDYKNNGYFFVNYTDNTVGVQSSARNTNISRFSVNPNNPNIADTSSELIILEIQQYSWNHNGGDIKFGPDGYLYIGMGDGGSSCDPLNKAQSLDDHLGKMLRIDVDNGSPYAIPPDNPFINNSGALNEIWAYGLRNPWRFSFDRHTGDMWIGDVGQNTWEEISYQPASSAGGENYGWKCYEANQYGTCSPSFFSCTGTSQTAPVHAYVNGSDCSVTGGYVYRGCEHPALFGHYIFGDYCSGKIWTIYDNGGAWATTSQGTFSANISSFGEDYNGEIYVADLGGKIFRIDEASSNSPLSVSVSATGTCDHSAEGAVALTVSGGIPPYSYDWSNGASTKDINGLAPGTYEVIINDAHQCSITESVNIEEYATPVASFTAPNTGCTGSAISFTNASSITSGDITSIIYDFKDGNTSITPDPDHVFVQSGSYEVCLIATSDMGCEDTFSQATIIYDGMLISIDSVVNASCGTCQDGGIYITVTSGTPPYAFTWSNLFTTEDLNGVMTGSYCVWATDMNGCVDSICVFVDSLGICDKQAIPINLGWNMISSYVEPSNPAILDIFGPVLSDILIIKNGSGQATIPSLGIDVIQNWNVVEGYKIKTTDSLVTYIGCSIVDPLTTPIPLDAGWSMIAYLRTQPLDITAALSGITNDIVLVKDAHGESYIPSISINTIGEMEPGQGYKIKLSGSATLYYPDNAKTFPPSNFNPPGKPKRFSNISYTGSNATVIIPVNAVNGISIGDEIGIFNAEGILTGSALFEGRNLAITVWGNDETGEEVYGMKENDTFIFSVWSKSSNTEFTAEASYESGESLYREDGISILKSLSRGLFSREERHTIKVYPNPFTLATEVYFYLEQPGSVQIKLFNINGGQFEIQNWKQMVSGQHNILITDTLIREPGFYFLQIDNGKERRIVKLIKL